MSAANSPSVRRCSPASDSTNAAHGYPSKDSLALGLIDAKTPASWFDTDGWVYLSGKPIVVKDGRAIKVEDIRVWERRIVTAARAR
jgi:hypothetical protein